MTQIPAGDEIRERTDDSLRAERIKVDSELGKRLEGIARSADAVTERARTVADQVVQKAREEADKTKASCPEKVQDERARADGALESEREAADALVNGERAARRQALDKLLSLEREETDHHLLNERGWSDEAVGSRDLFLGMASHDLRTLLGGIAMNAELLGRGAAPAVLPRVENIQRLAARMNRLLGDLVDVASIEAGKLVTRLDEGDVREAIREAVDAFQPLAASHGVSLQVEEGPELRAAFDRERMLQVLANLIGNALKFCPRGATVTVAAQVEGGMASISVSDDGPGIPQENLEAIFGRYWQAGRNDRRGLGLGLYISRCILEGHGGRIWAESSGQGSTFRLAWPASGQKKEAAEDRSPAAVHH